MSQDANKIIDILGGGYAQESLNLRKQLAILTEENVRLKQENESLKAKLSEETGEHKSVQKETEGVGE